MIKNIISPIQAWLLSQKRCVGCGTSLDILKKELKRNKQTVQCKCGRVFVFNSQTKTYRRASIEEI